MPRGAVFVQPTSPSRCRHWFRCAVLSCLLPSPSTARPDWVPQSETGPTVESSGRGASSTFSTSVPEPALRLTSTGLHTRWRSQTIYSSCIAGFRRLMSLPGLPIQLTVPAPIARITGDAIPPQDFITKFTWRACVPPNSHGGRAFLSSSNARGNLTDGNPRDSNPGPLAPDAATLPLEPRRPPQKAWFGSDSSFCSSKMDL